MRLSHSQVSKYTMCPKSYEYHYIKRLRPKLNPASLIFGSALDSGLNELLLPTGRTPEEVFIETFTSVNGVSVKDNINYTYAASDFDGELLPELSDEDAATMSILKEKKTKYGLEGLTEEERVFFNGWHWESLKVKGLLMLQAYRTKVLPLIEKVIAVQVPIDLTNGDDSITGFIDFIAEIKGHGTCLLDNKTSSIEYAKDSVIVSPQLALYKHAVQHLYPINKAGYVVMRKQVVKNRNKICSKCGYDGSAARHTTCPNTIEGKRCGGSWNETISPDINIQIILDEIPTKTENLVLDNYDVVNHAIKSGIFPRNLHTCNNVFGGQCPYYKLCYKDSTEGLEEVT